MKTEKDHATRRHRSVRRMIPMVCTVLSLALLVACPAWADGPEACALCHQAEIDAWQRSPHALAAARAHQGTAQQCQEAESETCTCLACHSTGFDTVDPSVDEVGVTCEGCHGPYVEGHPGEAVMRLDVDSTTCSTCHVQTYEEWRNTAHGQAGVQCIGCHRSHSQDLRLGDEYLCTSCHEDRIQDLGHIAHQRAGIDCVECHTSPAVRTVRLDGAVANQVSHSHSFVVDTETCARCHGATFHSGTTMAATPNIDAGQSTTANPSTAAIGPWLQTAGPGSIGLGIAIGGMMGIIFVLLAGHFQQRERRTLQ